MSNLVQTSVRLRNELQHTNWTIEELQRLYINTKENVKYDYSTECFTDLGGPLKRKRSAKKKILR